MWKRHIGGLECSGFFRVIGWDVKGVDFELSAGGHMSIKIEKVGVWNHEEGAYYSMQENDVSLKVAKIRMHKQPNQKKIWEL